MKPLILALALSSGFAGSSLALDTGHGTRKLGRSDVRTAEPSYRYHQRRAYDARRRASPYAEGVTCRTPTLVCWVQKPLKAGANCSCDGGRQGVLTGKVEG